MKNLKTIIISLLVILILVIAAVIFIGKNQPRNNIPESTESAQPLLPCGKAGETLGGEIDHCCPGLSPSPLSKRSFGGLFECK